MSNLIFLRKLLVTILLIAFCSFFTYSQSGFRTQTSQGLPDIVNAKQVSLNNAWFGSTFSYGLNNNVDFEENFLFNANVLYNISFDSTAWNFPVVGNVELPLSGQSFQDIEIGIYPWRVINTWSSGTVFVLHGGLSYEVNPTTEEGSVPQDFKILFGGEVSVPIGDNRLPLTVSVTPLFQTFNLDRGSNLGLEGTVILPIAPNLGIIGEVYTPFKSSGNIFGIGVLMNSSFSN